MSPLILINIVLFPLTLKIELVQVLVLDEGV